MTHGPSPLGFLPLREMRSCRGLGRGFSPKHLAINMKGDQHVEGLGFDPNNMASKWIQMVAMPHDPVATPGSLTQAIAGESLS